MHLFFCFFPLHFIKKSINLCSVTKQHLLAVVQRLKQENGRLGMKNISNVNVWLNKNHSKKDHRFIGTRGYIRALSIGIEPLPISLYRGLNKGKKLQHLDSFFAGEGRHMSFCEKFTPGDTKTADNQVNRKHW